MAHFARIVNNTVVAKALVLNCSIGGCIGPNHWAYEAKDHLHCGTLDFPESELLGQAFLKSIGEEGEWLQYSYNANFRGATPTIGSIYDPQLDIFIVKE